MKNNMFTDQMGFLKLFLSSLFALKFGQHPTNQRFNTAQNWPSGKITNATMLMTTKQMVGASLKALRI